MKKIFLSLLFSCFAGIVFAQDNIHNAVYDGSKIYYSPLNQTWSFESTETDDLVFTKKLIEGDGGYSIYNKEDGSFAFVLNTDYELINNGKLIIVDNNLLKYYKLIYDGTNHEQIELTDEEINSIFPDAEIYKISSIDSDNKMWIHKPFLEDKKFILVNDTDRFFHRINCKSKDVQDIEIKGLFTVSKYGIIRFTHYGERNGKITFYVR